MVLAEAADARRHKGGETEGESDMSDLVIVSIAEGLGDADTLCAKWNADPELFRRGNAMAPGAGQSFPIDPVSIGTAIVIGVASGVGKDLIIAGLKKLFGGGPKPQAPFNIVVEDGHGGQLKLRVERP
jgi:hypothetical protein